jgi:hypothetical protein
LNFLRMSCWKYYHAVFIICHLTAMISACCNPFIYGKFNDSFRKEFLELCPLLSVFCGSCESAIELENPIELQMLENNVKINSRV